MGCECFSACYAQVSGVCTLPSPDQTILSPSTSITDLSTQDLFWLQFVVSNEIYWSPFFLKLQLFTHVQTKSWRCSSPRTFYTHQNHLSSVKMRRYNAYEQVLSWTLIWEPAVSTESLLALLALILRTIGVSYPSINQSGATILRLPLLNNCWSLLSTAQICIWCHPVGLFC